MARRQKRSVADLPNIRHMKQDFRHGPNLERFFDEEPTPEGTIRDRWQKYGAAFLSLEKRQHDLKGWTFDPQDLWAWQRFGPPAGWKG